MHPFAVQIRPAPDVQARVVRLSLYPIDLLDPDDDVARSNTHHELRQEWRVLRGPDMFARGSVHYAWPVVGGSAVELLARAVECFIQASRLHGLEQVVERAHAKGLDGESIER